MPKKIIQDIVVKKQKSLRVEPSKQEDKRLGKHLDKRLDKRPDKRLDKPKRVTQKTSKGKIFFGVVVFSLLVIVGMKAVDAFSGAIIRVNVHQEIIEVDTVLKSGKSAFYDLPYETMEIQLTEERKVDAVDVKNVESKASGEIIIFNAYSSKPQPLIANTRFEAPDGKIYRIDKKIVVPGAKIENAEIIPSSIEATVYADEPGEEYNIGLSDFSIPGFKNGLRYEKFYARSKTPLAGGFKGFVPTISEENEKKLREELEKSIKDKILQKARTQIPDGFLFYDNASQISFTEDESVNLPTSDNQDLKFTVKETGGLLAFLLPRKELSKTLVKKYLGEEFQNKVEITNLEDLKFDLVSYDSENRLVIFGLRGKAEFTWLIEEEELKNALMAAPKDLEGVFKSFPAIDQASVVFKPSWWHFLPEKASKISVEEIRL